MSTTPFIGEIKLFAGNFAILGHALCNGQLMSIAQNTALFSLLGTTYGGNGTVTFGLPDLRGRFPLGQGQGPGLTNRTMGEAGGAESVTLINAQLPIHTHILNSSTTVANSNNPSVRFWAKQPSLNQYASAPTGGTNMNAGAISNAGGSQPHNNMDPYLTINYIIALEGIFPSRN